MREQSAEETCRELTLSDVQKALFPLTDRSDQFRCCALLRLDRQSSRLTLPLARRSRTDFSQHPSVDLCSKCHRIKEEQYVHLRREVEFPLISTDEQLRLTTDSDYSASPEMLLWKINGAEHSIVQDTGSLTAEEKKTLLHQTLTKLQLMLLNQSSNDEHQRTACRALQKTIEVLSSSIHRLK